MIYLTCRLSYDIKPQLVFLAIMGGGSNPIFSQDTPKFGFGDGQKWEKKVYGKRGKQTFYFQNRKNPQFFP